MSPHAPGVVDTGDAPPQAGGLLAIFWIGYIIAFCHVALRFYSRRYLEGHFGADDWLLAASMIFVTTMGGALTIAAHSHPDPSAPTVATLKSMLAFNFVYWFAIGSLKMSILWFFYRTVQSLRVGKDWTKPRALILMTLSFTFVHSVVAAFVSAYSKSSAEMQYTDLTQLVIFSCNPMSLLWTPSTNLKKDEMHDRCIDILLVQGINSVISGFFSTLMLAGAVIFITESALKRRHPGESDVHIARDDQLTLQSTETLCCRFWSRVGFWCCLPCAYIPCFRIYFQAN